MSGSHSGQNKDKECPRVHVSCTFGRIITGIYANPSQMAGGGVDCI